MAPPLFRLAVVVLIAICVSDVALAKKKKKKKKNKGKDLFPKVSKFSLCGCQCKCSPASRQTSGFCDSPPDVCTGTTGVGEALGLVDGQSCAPKFKLKRARKALPKWKEMNIKKWSCKGRIALDCGAGKTRCSGGCTDLASDGAHCGRCNNKCAAGLECRAGECSGLSAGLACECGCKTRVMGACVSCKPCEDASSPPTTVAPPEKDPDTLARGVAYVWVREGKRGSALAALVGLDSAAARGEVAGAVVGALRGLVVTGAGRGINSRGLKILRRRGRRLAEAAVAPNAVVVPAPRPPLSSTLFASGRLSIHVRAVDALVDRKDKGTVAVRVEYELQSKEASLLEAAAHALNTRRPEQVQAAIAAALKPLGLVVTKAHSTGAALLRGRQPPPPTPRPSRPPTKAVVPLTQRPTTAPPSASATQPPSPTWFGGFPSKFKFCGAFPGCVAKRWGVTYLAGTGEKPCYSCPCQPGTARRMMSNRDTRNLHHFCTPVPTAQPTPVPTPFPTPAQPQTFRIVSESHYALIDVQVPTGTQLATNGNGIPARGVHDVPLGSNGLASVPVTLGVGHYEPNGQKTVYWSWTHNVPLNSAGVTTFTPTDPSVHTLLTKWDPALTYSGQFWVGTTPHTAALRFTSAGGWTLFTDGEFVGSGQVTLLAWPDYSMFIVWTIEPGNEDRKVNWAFPWSCFKMRNGPPSWPVIEYCP